jgi:hypothetical protein
MNRWQATPLQRSCTEAERCAREMVVRLNSTPMPLGSFISDRMPAVTGCLLTTTSADRIASPSTGREDERRR